MTVDLSFLPWFRTGVSTFVDTVDDGVAPARYATTATLTIDGATDTVSVPITLHGPGDVEALGRRTVRAREPAQGSVDFEPNYLAHLDFVDPDFPWRFTPMAPDGDGRLRPWLVLIALERSETSVVRAGAPAPGSWVEAPIAELPDLVDSPIWAHVQVAGPFDATPLADVVRTDPSRAIARLVCPRRFEPASEYMVCLVPAFEIGRRVGMGEAPDGAGVEPSWTYDPSSPAHVRLPVYDHWRFSTSLAGDFESIARELSPHQLTASARRPFVVDPLLTAGAARTLTLEGALQPMIDPPPPEETVTQDIVDALTAWMNHAADVEESGGDPQVGPPIYGGVHADATRVGEQGGAVWLDEINLDPRQRLAAAAGADVVQASQDEFVDIARDQVGDLPAAGRLLQRSQLARAVGKELARKHLRELPSDVLMQVAGPGHARTKAGPQTLKRTVSTSSVPELGFDGAFRRMSRVRGPQMQRWSGGHPHDGGDTLFEQRFRAIPLEGWTVDDAQHAVMGPSNWGWSGDGSSLYQTSNIYVPDTAPGENAVSKRATMYIAGPLMWRDQRISFSVTPSDDDAVGFVFRFQNDRYYYRFSMDSERKYRRLVRVYAGGVATLWEDAYAYTPGATYGFDVSVEGDRIVIKMGTFVATTTIVDLHDPLLAYGRFGFYTWGSHNTRFFNIRAYEQAGLNQSELASHVTDGGNTAGPSQWRTDSGGFAQLSNIYSPPHDRDHLPKLGTYLSVGDQTWGDYVIESNVDSDDDDAFGFMFRLRDANNFYRFSMDQSRSYMRVVKCVAGQYSLLWQIDEGYATPILWHAMKIVADGSRLRGYLADRRLFDIRDRDHPDGGVAFYCWGNAGTRWTQVSVNRLRRRGIIERLNAGELGISIPAGTELDLDALGQTFLAESDSETTVPAKVLDRLVAPPDALASRDELDEVVVGPELPVPLAPRLTAIAPHLMLPGVEQLPADSVTLLRTNPAFVAAFMAGANDEMSRELHWRGFTTDARATTFRQFWDVRGGQHDNSSPAAVEAHRDIPPLDSWPLGSSLDEIAGVHTSGMTIFVVRSELVRRFPEASYFLTRALPDGEGGREPGTEDRLYLFRGGLAPDTAYFGFDLAPEEVRGSGSGADLGWYLTIEQPPTGTRYGLDVGGAAGDTLASWSDLAWSHVGTDANLDASTFNAVAPTGSGQPVWAHNGAHMAAITLQRPTRIFIHAERLVATPEPIPPPEAPPPEEPPPDEPPPEEPKPKEPPPDEPPPEEPRPKEPPPDEPPTEEPRPEEPTGETKTSIEGSGS